jgi:hypothetical protein
MAPATHHGADKTLAQEQKTLSPPPNSTNRNIHTSATKQDRNPTKQITSALKISRVKTAEEHRQSNRRPQNNNTEKQHQNSRGRRSYSDPNSRAGAGGGSPPTFFKYQQASDSHTAADLQHNPEEKREQTQGRGVARSTQGTTPPRRRSTGFKPTS